MKILHIIACVTLALTLTATPALAKKDKKNDDSGKKHAEQTVKNKNKSKDADNEPAKSDNPDKKLDEEGSKANKSESGDNKADNVKKKKADDSKKEEEKAVSDKWTADDIKGFCSAKEAAGSRALDDCISRNQRRIGRVKSQFDMNEIERGKPQE